MCIDGHGYLKVGLYNSGVTLNKKVHKLMHMTFIDKFNQNKPCIDHIDRDKTNNHIDNLRECTYQENNRNMSKQKNVSSKYIGVRFHIRDCVWESNIRVDGNKIYLGSYKTEIEAAKVYDSVAKYYYPEYINLNFPNNSSILPTTIEEIKEKLNKLRINKKSSRFNGVCWTKRMQWVVNIRICKSDIHLGYFKDEIEAAKAYDKALIEGGGNLSKLNFKESLL